MGRCCRRATLRRSRVDARTQRWSDATATRVGRRALPTFRGHRRLARAMDQGRPVRDAGAFRLAGGPLADRAHPAVRERGRSPVHLSRPGHLLPPGVRHRRASWAGPGLGPPVRTPGPAFGSGTSMRRGAACSPPGRLGPGRVGAGRAGSERGRPRATRDRVRERACRGVRAPREPRERRTHSSWVGCRGSSSPVIGAAPANAVIRTAGRL